ncbi:MAG: MFS transporter [Gammaproteobacteria bacterium]|nr:MFS transporter [Gammaproteobacteria bacterium]MYE86796.1 MFS transporter [Gammaproteobacteria bacterium]MYF10077.1 MFS transporter [Gammaproteobacteria bacterium]MYF50005.1 MFS transporter [Gammaproteobacteria bacterium]MYG13605.1 MFS transporter [Gammaproteobacteria bacterium]
MDRVAGGGYRRADTRAGALPLSTRLFQGSGGMPDALKQFAFSTFLLFYYNRVLGMDAYLVSLALMVALILDAVTDPYAGSISDNLRTRWGRRHPMMLLSVPLLAVGLFGLFAPIEGLSGPPLFCWLLAFAVMTRIGMTLFAIPWEAMFVELTDDYAERSVLIAYKYLFVWLASAAVGWASWTFIFPATEAHSPGHLNPAAYERFALVIAASISGAALFTTLLTYREVPYLLQPTRSAAVASISRAVRELLLAFRNRNFLVLIAAALTSAVIIGMLLALEIYMHTYFWQLGSEEIRWFSLASLLGVVLAFLVMQATGGRIDKRNVLLTAYGFTILESGGLVCSRLAGILPQEGPFLLSVLVASMAVRVSLLTLTGVCASSMAADCVDVQELRTGRRQEGVFSSAIQFISKISTGFGLFLSGLLVSWLALPEQADSVSLAGGTLWAMGLTVGLGIPLLQLIPILLIFRYRLTAAQHAEVAAQLAARHAPSQPGREGSPTPLETVADAAPEAGAVNRGGALAQRITRPQSRDN